MEPQAEPIKWNQRNQRTPHNGTNESGTNESGTNGTNDRTEKPKKLRQFFENDNPHAEKKMIFRSGIFL